jgi:hypothetical protein
VARWKLGPQGAYYDPTDTGPDQVAPPGGTSQQPRPPQGGYFDEAPEETPGIIETQQRAAAGAPVTPPFITPPPADVAFMDVKPTVSAQSNVRPTGGGPVGRMPLNEAASTPTLTPVPGDTSTRPVGYAPIQGFDFKTLSTGGGNAGKYTPAVRTFSQMLNAGVPIARGQLAAMVNNLRLSGFPNASAVGDDKIDFGDGNGPIDVIMSNGSIWFNNQPGPPGGGAGSGTGGGAGGTGGATGSAGGTGTGAAGRTSGAASIGSTGSYLQPGLAPPGGQGVFSGPLQQVGQDPFSQLITSGLGGLISSGGQTPFSAQVGERLLQILGDGDDGGLDAQAMRRFESARELEGKARRTMLNESRAELADRGLLGEPGMPAGTEANVIRRINEQLAPEFARSLRDIYSDLDAQSNQRTVAALSAATGLATAQANTLLQSLGAGTDRQQALATIALKTLEQDAQWNQFLAEFGLKRDQVIAALENQDYAMIKSLIDAFQTFASLSKGGYVGAS